MANRMYEILIAFEPALTVQDIDAALMKIVGIVRDAKGEVKAVERPGVRRLAFRVRGRTDANFIVMTTVMPVTCVKPIEAGLRLHEGVLRYMTTRLNPVVPPPPAHASAPAHHAAPPASPAAPPPPAPPAA
jgi:small subunit ribosomal protein S6